MEQTVNDDGSWNWEALERHFQGQYTPAEIREMFQQEEAEAPEETLTVELYPELTDVQLVDWLLCTLPTQPEIITEGYILWRLKCLRQQNPVLYARFKVQIGNL